MSTLDQLFPDGKQRREEQVVLDDHHTARRLDERFGDRRADLDKTHRASGRQGLVALVDAAVADAKQLTATAPAGSADHRRRRHHIDVLNIVLGSVAVVAIAAAGLVGAVQAANASPADDAMRVLVIDEKTIESANAGLVAARQRVTDAIAEADASAEALGSRLDAVREAPDPADIPEGSAGVPKGVDMMAVADPAALQAMSEAITAYRADLAAFELPQMPVGYSRGAVDADSLQDVAKAIDAAQLHLTEIDRSTADIRSVRAVVEARAETFAEAARAFASSFAATAQSVIDGHPDAGSEAHRCREKGCAGDLGDVSAN